MKHASMLGTALLACWLVAGAAHAQLDHGTWRFGLDTDVFSGGVVRLDPDGPAKETKDSVISVGPNALGNSLRLISTAPLGVDVGYVLKPKWLLDVRTGFGFDRINPDGADNKIKVIAFSFMPGIKYVPMGGEVKPFIHFSPVLMYERAKQGSAKDYLFTGCFSVGVGAFLFTSARASVDVGAYFEGRFGKFHHDPGGSYERISDMRGVLRVGVAFWR